jgi:hypothetical protein
MRGAANSEASDTVYILPPGMRGRNSAERDSHRPRIGRSEADWPNRRSRKRAAESEKGNLHRFAELRPRNCAGPLFAPRD